MTPAENDKVPPHLGAPHEFDEDRFSDTLVNVFGINLPEEMLPEEYSMFMEEYSKQTEQQKRTA